MDGFRRLVEAGMPGTVLTSRSRMRRARARVVTMSPAHTARSTTWIFLPSRMISVSIRSGSPTGTGRTMSTVRRVRLIAVNVGTSSTTCPSRASTAPPL